MTESDTRGAPPSSSQELKLPPMSPSLSRQSDGHAPLSNQRHQQRSPPLLPSSSAKGSSTLPPPPPTRLHSYHHPIAASYASNGSSSSYYDRSRQAPPPLWKELRSPPLEHRSSRVLPPLSTSSSSNGSSGSAFQLPSLSASLPSSTSWHGRESSHGGLNGTHASAFRTSREAFSAEARRTGQEPKLPSLSSGHFADYRQSQPESSSAAVVSPSTEEPPQAGRKPAKAHVPSACLNCKRAHLACDVGRPCRRCVNLGKSDTCIDVQHKKRGRPRLKDRPSSQAGVTTLQSLEGKSDVSGSPASASYARQSPGSEQGYFRSPTRNNELLSPPLLSSSTVMQVSGRTHGHGAHPRSASNSVSASSYPYSRPDHIRHPSDVGSYGNAYPTPSWSSYHQQQQQNGSHGHESFGKPTSTPGMGQRQHSHSLSYEQQSYQPHQHQHQQQQQQGQQQPQHGQGHASSQPLGSASDASDSVVSAVVTIICSTNLQCARVSDECSALLGYQPSDLNERSLFELVHPSETSRLQDIWTSLIDPVGVVPQAVPAAAEVVMSTPAARLMTPAAGTIFVQENMRLRQRNGMYDFYSVRLHLGGGFGVDLYRRETLDRAYIVASLLKLGNDAVHPDPAILRSPYSHDSSQSRGFRTPSGPPAAPAVTPASRNGRWEANEANARASHQHEQMQRPRSESVNQRSAHLESHVRRNEEVMQPSKVDANGSPREDRWRGVKRSSADMDEDEPVTTVTRPAPSSQAANQPAAAAAATTASNTSSYSASKHAACSPPPVVHSLLSSRTRGTSRDGILC